MSWFRQRVARRLLLAAGVAAALPALLAPGVAADSPFTVVAQGLDNPRGITIAPNGAIYVAEAGKGGEGPCITSPEGGDAVCLGASGAITRIWKGEQERVVSDLPSLAGADGSSAVGPTDVDVLGNGVIRTLIGLGGAPDARGALGEGGAAIGRLVTVRPNGTWSIGTDIAAYEAAANPAGGPVDPNPYSILARGTTRAVVADAGGNDLLEVDAHGDVSTLAVFPPVMVPVDQLPDFVRAELPPGMTEFPAEPVPPSVVVGPDGAYYVGELTGFPFPVGRARVWRVAPGEAPTVYATGFTNIIDLTFGPDGSLYVLEIAKDGLLAAEGAGPDSPPAFGALIRVKPDGTQTEVASDGLVMPGGVAFGKDGFLYVTNFSVMAGAGQVVRIHP